MLADTAEVNRPKNLEMHKSGLQMWRLLKNNFDRAFASSVTSNLESILNMQEATSVQDVMSTLNTSLKDAIKYTTDKTWYQMSQNSLI